MSTNIYVGNLAFETTSADLQRLFEEHGAVSRAQVIVDRDTGASRGFGFIEMSSAEEARNAISSIDGQSVDGRTLKVNIAKKRA